MSSIPMCPFQLEARGTECLVRLTGEVTIEHARALHAALLAAIPGATRLHIDASTVEKVDAAALQILLAAARQAAPELVEGSGAWTRSLQRYGLSASSLCVSPAR